MNNRLTSEIIRHIYSQLGVRFSGFNNHIHSIMDGEYLLSKKISFEDGEKKPIWGIQTTLEDNVKFYIALADMSTDDVPEFAMVANLEDAPIYGTYFSYPEFNKNEEVELDRPMIACYISGASWAECTMYMQGAFLSGMEKLKEAAPKFSKTDNEAVVDNLIKFIEFYQDKMEMENEGQED